MAIETLDLRHSSGYKHLLSHELETIFYVIIWHTLGYRHMKGIYPADVNGPNTDQKKRDMLKDWRTGSCTHVANANFAKVAFINRPMPVIDSITSPFLQIITLRMVDLFSTRQMALLSRGLYLEEMKLEARPKFSNTQDRSQYGGHYPRLRLLYLARKMPFSRSLRGLGA